MSFNYLTEIISTYLLFVCCLFLLAGSVALSFKMRFIQVRLLAELFRTLKSSVLKRQSKENAQLVLPHKALLTAMSTTLGISTIVAPVIAICLGGPGALIGFLLTAFFGSAATYTEVNLCIQYRKKLPDGRIEGGPMSYLSVLLSPAVAKYYAFLGFVLMMVWSGAQANQIAAILDSPLLGAYRIPTYLSGCAIVLLVLGTLAGGIQRLSALSSKLVPLMFILYVSSSLFILFFNVERLGDIFYEILYSAFSPHALINGTIVGGIVNAMRWGIFKGVQVTEAGVGTQAIPHSLAATNDPNSQGVLAMFSTYTAGLVAFLSGCVALVTGTWQNPDLPIGISMVVASYEQYFSFFGIAIIAISAFLFAFGTIVGNCYNGSYLFNYISKGRALNYYFALSSLMIFLGSIGEVTLVWTVGDIFLACIVIPHMTALLIHVFKKSENTVLQLEAESVY